MLKHSLSAPCADQPNGTGKSLTHKELPKFILANALNCHWGTADDNDVAKAIKAACLRVVHWRRNIFLVSSGREGKEFFMTEMTRLFQACADCLGLEQLALDAAMTIPLLLLQEPHSKSKAKDHTNCLIRRLAAWKSDDINCLVEEGRPI